MTRALKRFVAVVAALVGCAVLVAQQLRDTPAQTTPTGTALISGRVITTDQPPQPVRRAMVTIAGDLSPGRSTITDDDGSFVFADLPAGRFTLSATRPSFISGSYGATRPGRPGTAITIAAGEQAHDLTIVIAHGAVITGTIRDEDGQPASDVEVTVLRVDAGAAPAGGPPASAAENPSAVTDDRGVYRVFGLAAGDYVVAAVPAVGIFASGGDVTVASATDVDAQLAALQQRRSGGSPAPMPTARGSAPESAAARFGPTYGAAPIFYPGTPVAADAETIGLALGGERTSVDFAIRLVPTATIDGTVASDDGRVPAGVQMSVMTFGGLPRPAGMMYRPTFAVQPGADGHFRFTKVTPGRYTILARVARPQPRWAEADVTINGSDVADLRLTLQAGLHFSGRVVLDVAASRPPDDLTTVTLLLSPLGAGMPASTRVQPDGAFDMADVIPGRYRLTCPAPCVAGFWLASATAAGRDLLDVPPEFTPAGGDLRDVVVTLSNRHTEVSGVLETSAGQPVSNGYVVVFPTDRAAWRPQTRRIQAVRPGTDGQFVLRDLPPGEYLMAVVTDAEPNDWFKAEFLEQLVPAAVKIALADGEHKTQNLQMAR